MYNRIHNLAKVDVARSNRVTRFLNKRLIQISKLILYLIKTNLKNNGL